MIGIEKVYFLFGYDKLVIVMGFSLCMIFIFGYDVVVNQLCVNVL